MAIVDMDKLLIKTKIVIIIIERNFIIDDNMYIMSLFHFTFLFLFQNLSICYIDIT